jgi:hypothetical protein
MLLFTLVLTECVRGLRAQPAAREPGAAFCWKVGRAMEPRLLVAQVGRQQLERLRPSR